MKIRVSNYYYYFDEKLMQKSRINDNIYITIYDAHKDSDPYSMADIYLLLSVDPGDEIPLEFAEDLLDDFTVYRIDEYQDTDYKKYCDMEDFWDGRI